MSNYFLFILFIVILLVRLPSVIEHYRYEGQSFPSFKLRLIGVDNHYMSDQEFSERSVSKAKIIIFWATWCLPCRVELARIQKLLDYGFISKESVLAIAFNEEISLVEQVSKKRDYAFPIVVDEAGELAQKLNISLTPTILLVEGHRILWMSSGLSLLLELRLMLQGVL